MRIESGRSGGRRQRLRAVVLAAGFLVLSMALAEGIQTQEEKVSTAVDLPALLDKLTAYARRLENVALDFICREEIA